MVAGERDLEWEGGGKCMYFKGKEGRDNSTKPLHMHIMFLPLLTTNLRISDVLPTPESPTSTIL